jgi:hypothetical protein
MFIDLLFSFDDTPRSIDAWTDRVDHVTAYTDADFDAVLIRPDGYIAWSSADDEPLETALARWFGGRLHHTHRRNAALEELSRSHRVGR